MAAYYNGMEFKTALEARWAAFFDLAGWTWQGNPKAIKDWRPDFVVRFPCSHSECRGSHTILIAVLPVSDLSSVRGHPCFAHMYIVKDDNGNWVADAGALFGNGPTVTTWNMSHGSGGGIEDVSNWVSKADGLWEKTKSLIK